MLEKIKDLEIYSQTIDLGFIKILVDFNARFTTECIEIDIFVAPQSYYAVWSP